MLFLFPNLPFKALRILQLPQVVVKFKSQFTLSVLLNLLLIAAVEQLYDSAEQPNEGRGKQDGFYGV